MCATIVNIYSVVHLSHICNMTHIRGLNGVVDKKLAQEADIRGSNPIKPQKYFASIMMTQIIS